MGVVPVVRGRWRPLIGALLVSLLLVAGALPASASEGGRAEATGVRARAPEVNLDVQATGAVAAAQPILDRLTRDPVLGGREEMAAHVTTPAAPEGTESADTPRLRLPGLVTVEEIRASTTRVAGGELSAHAAAGAVHVGLLGIDVLRVEQVRATATTDPHQEPTAAADEVRVEAFGRSMPVPTDDPIDVDEYLSTNDVLEMLEEAFPGLGVVVSAVGGVLEAGGGVQVQIGRTAEADPDTGAATAVGLHAGVALAFDARICIPNRSDGCVAEVTIRADATVLDLVLAETTVERPRPLPDKDLLWVVPLVVVGALVVFGLGLYLGRRRSARTDGNLTDAPPTTRAGQDGGEP
ncbi:MAG TPA: hypothetical protein VK063_05330 [Beutenbergiaceae bacterium]|nr:hypothetical protein [Beutenbergiaceae bacterium]